MSFRPSRVSGAWRNLPYFYLSFINARGDFSILRALPARAALGTYRKLRAGQHDFGIKTIRIREMFRLRLAPLASAQHDILEANRRSPNVISSEAVFPIMSFRPSRVSGAWRNLPYFYLSFINARGDFSILRALPARAALGTYRKLRAGQHDFGIKTIRIREMFRLRLAPLASAQHDKLETTGGAT